MVDEGRRSPGTLSTYESALALHVRPALGQLRLAEVTTPVVDAFIARIKLTKGAPAAKLARSIVSGVMGIAVRQGAVSVNPARDVERIESKPKKAPRALTSTERSDLMARLRSDQFAVRHDLPDLVLFMIATGARIGETLALVWAEVDLDAGTVDISSTIIRVKGEGLLRKRTKSAAGQRVLALPAWAVDMLTHRYARGARLDEPVFPDTLGGFRDPSNTLKVFRQARGTTDDLLGWVTTHSLRKTTATILDGAGLSARAVADQLGHARPSMTQDVYLGRRLKSPEAAAALQHAMPDEDQSHG
jgi:integrase